MKYYTRQDWPAIWKQTDTIHMGGGTSILLDLLLDSLPPKKEWREHVIYYLQLERRVHAR